jgi:hypothetical protein
MSASSLRRIVLHLLGYDHELPEQAQKMRAIEARVLDAIKTTERNLIYFHFMNMLCALVPFLRKQESRAQCLAPKSSLP